MAAPEYSERTNKPVDTWDKEDKDIAFRRLGAPEDFIAWILKAVAGHSRIVSTCAGTTDRSERFSLGGLAQGCPFSPAIWVVLADMALCHAQLKPGIRRPAPPKP